MGWRDSTNAISEGGGLAAGFAAGFVPAFTGEYNRIKKAESDMEYMKAREALIAQRPRSKGSSAASSAYMQKLYATAAALAEEYGGDPSDYIGQLLQFRGNGEKVRENMDPGNGTNGLVPYTGGDDGFSSLSPVETESVAVAELPSGSNTGGVAGLPSGSNTNDVAVAGSSTAVVNGEMSNLFGNIPEIGSNRTTVFQDTAGTDLVSVDDGDINAITTEEGVTGEVSPETPAKTSTDQNFQDFAKKHWYIGKDNPKIWDGAIGNDGRLKTHFGIDLDKIDNLSDAKQAMAVLKNNIQALGANGYQLQPWHRATYNQIQAAIHSFGELPDVIQMLGEGKRQEVRLLLHTDAWRQLEGKVTDEKLLQWLKSSRSAFKQHIPSVGKTKEEVAQQINNIKTNNIQLSPEVRGPFLAILEEAHNEYKWKEKFEDVSIGSIAAIKDPAELKRLVLNARKLLPADNYILNALETAISNPMHEGSDKEEIIARYIQDMNSMDQEQIGDAIATVSRIDPENEDVLEMLSNRYNGEGSVDITKVTEENFNGYWLIANDESKNQLLEWANLKNTAALIDATGTDILTDKTISRDQLALMRETITQKLEAGELSTAETKSLQNNLAMIKVAQNIPREFDWSKVNKGNWRALMEQQKGRGNPTVAALIENVGQLMLADASNELGTDQKDAELRSKQMKDLMGGVTALNSELGEVDTKVGNAFQVASSAYRMMEIMNKYGEVNYVMGGKFSALLQTLQGELSTIFKTVSETDAGGLTAEAFKIQQDLQKGKAIEYVNTQFGNDPELQKKAVAFVEFNSIRQGLAFRIAVANQGGQGVVSNQDYAVALSQISPQGGKAEVETALRTTVNAAVKQADVNIKQLSRNPSVSLIQEMQKSMKSPLDILGKTFDPMEKRFSEYDMQNEWGWIQGGYAGEPFSGTTQILMPTPEELKFYEENPTDAITTHFIEKFEPWMKHHNYTIMDNKLNMTGGANE